MQNGSWQSPEIVQLEAGDALGEGWTVCFCAVSISVWKGGRTANSFTWSLLWFWSSWKTHANQNLFVSFLFQAFLEAAKNVFCICSYADFCFHMAGNNSPDLYQPFPRNSSNSFKKYKREKSSGKEQGDVTLFLGRLFSPLGTRWTFNNTTYHSHLKEGFLGSCLALSRARNVKKLF